MVVYPNRRPARPLVWFVAGLLAGAALMLLLFFVIAGATIDDLIWVAASLIVLAVIAAAVGLLAFRFDLFQRLPHVRSTVLPGYALAALLTVINIGWMARVVFVDIYVAAMVTLISIFATVVVLLFGYLHANTISQKLDALTGAVEALALGRYQARVELPGKDQFEHLGAVVNLLATRLDVVARKERQIDRLRKNLTTWISYDLRLPLSSVRNIVEALADSTVDNPETYVRFMRTARRDINALSDLVDDLSDMTQVDVDGMTLDWSQASIADVIAATLDNNEALAEEKGVRLGGNGAPGLPLVEIDARQLGRALDNLISHALARTPAGGSVRLNAYPTRSGALVEIVDEYTGARPEDMTQLFEMLFGENDVRSQAAHTARLSLAMAGAIVEAHGSQIRVENVPNRGMRIVFTLAASRAVAASLRRGM